jgi:hypothetical protein
MDQTAAQNREVVGVLANRDDFETAVAALLDAGIEQSDLSVLSSHESLAVAGKPSTPWKEALTALVGEIKFEGPLVASGAILLAGGATAAALAGIIGAAVGGVALKEVLEEVAAKPHTEAFARSLAAGSVILWVRADDNDSEIRIISILQQNNAANVHVHGPDDRS